MWEFYDKILWFSVWEILIYLWLFGILRIRSVDINISIFRVGIIRCSSYEMILWDVKRNGYLGRSKV